MNAPDPRITAARADLAAAALEGKLEAPRFATGRFRRVVAPSVPLFFAADARARQQSELLMGEGFTVYDEADGFAWGQGEDGYVGYVAAASLGDTPEPTHRVSARLTHLYPEPDFKSRVLSLLSLGARLPCTPATERFAQTPFGYVPLAHLTPVMTRDADFVAVAEGLIGTPYLWGGRSAAGIDCSGLVQLSLAAAGRAVPRDSDLQENALDAHLPSDAPRKRGDLVFWKGHVAILRDAETLVHANVHAMAVAVEGLRAAIDRIAAAGEGHPTSFGRFETSGAA